MRILIVDDAVFIRKILKGIFLELGHEVIAEAATGQEAIKLASSLKPELITLDITMPDIDGLLAMKKIKEVSPDSAIVMVSATSNQSLILEALKNGAENFITKPFTKEKVEEIVISLNDNKEKNNIISDIKIINEELYTTIVFKITSGITYNTFENYSKKNINIRFENCELSADIKDYYKLSNGLVEEIIFKKNSDKSLDLILVTDSKNYQITDKENKLEITIKYEEASIEWLVDQYKILLMNISNQYIKTQKIDEKSISIEIHNKAIFLSELNKKFDDGIIDIIDVKKSMFGYVCTIHFAKPVQYELNENDYSTELIIKQIVELKDFEIINNNDETNINIFLSDYSSHSTTKNEKNNIIIELENVTLSEKLAQQEKYSFDDGLVESLLFSKLNNNVIIEILTDVIRSNISLENNILRINLKANKAYILYDSATSKFIFQNIKKENSELELKDDNKSLSFTISDRYVNLIKDIIPKDDQIVEDIKISKEKNTYYGTILFKKKIKLAIEESKDNKSFYITFSILEDFSIINSFELDNFSKEVKLKIYFDKKMDFIYEHKGDEKYLLLKLLNTKIEKINQSPYTFIDGFIEKIHFYQSGPDTIIEVYSEINDFNITTSDECLEIVFKPIISTLDFDIENYRIIFSNLSENSVTISESEEENQINFYINNKELFLTPGVFRFENELIKAIQISKINTGYNVIIFTNKPIKLKIIQESNNLILLIKAYCKIENIEFVNNEEFKINLYYSGDLSYEAKNIEQNIIQIDLFDVLFNNIDTENLVKENEFIKNINIFKTDEDKLIIIIEHRLAKININDNKGDSFLEIILQKAFCEVKYLKEDKVIKFEYIVSPAIDFYEFNNLLLIKLFKDINRLKIINADTNDEYIRFIHSYETFDNYIIYILFNKSVKINWLLDQNNLIINFNEKEKKLKNETSNITEICLRESNNTINTTEIKNMQKPIIYLDAGHGGKNFGGVFEKIENGRVQKYFEKDINLNIVQKLAIALKEYGFTVKLTRKEDKDLSTNDRLSIIDPNEPGLFISIHIGTSTNKQIRGLNIYYNYEEKEINIINLAQLIKTKINDKNLTPVKDIVKGNEISILEKSEIPSLLLQIGHGTNIYDLLMLIDEKYTNKLADTIAESIDEHFSK